MTPCPVYKPPPGGAGVGAPAEDSVTEVRVVGGQGFIGDGCLTVSMAPTPGLPGELGAVPVPKPAPNPALFALW